MTSWRERLRSALRRGPPRPDDADIFMDLRSMVLGLDPAALELPDDESWTSAVVAVMELDRDGATASVVTVADGSVSLYLSTGGGVIGAGEHAAVVDVARRFRRLAAESRDLFQVTDAFPLPGPGEVRFHMRIGGDRRSAAAPEAALRSGRNQLADLYAAGQDVLTEIRLASE
jgi:hypothetical protein